MLTLRPMLLAGLFCFAVTAHGQNAPARSTPQTNAAAPAATAPTSTNAQAAEAAATKNSATRGSRGAGRTGRGASGRGSQAANQGAQPSAEGRTGITGVPGYRAGFRGPQTSPAPDATASVTVTGVDDGSAVPKSQVPVLPGVQLPHNAYGIAKGTPIHVRLQQPVDSGHAHNGQIVRGVLTSAVGNVPAGAPVLLTVVAVASAGQITSNGELSLQVISVNGEQVLSDVITAEGKEGPKLLPDDAPGRGTEAVFTPDQPLTLPAG